MKWLWTLFKNFDSIFYPGGKAVLQRVSWCGLFLASSAVQITGVNLM